MSRPSPRRLLVAEPQSMWRRTLAAVVRELGIAEVQECLGPAATLRGLYEPPGAHALVLSLDGDQDAALNLLERLRADPREAYRQLPVIVLAERCDHELLLRLQALQVHRMLLKPFKLRQVLLAVAAIWPGSVPEDDLRGA